MSLWLQGLSLIGLILLSAFFSMTETAMMAVNRHRLRHMAKRGNKLAATALWLLERVNKLLSVVLITNTAINALISALITSIAISTFGNNDRVLTITTAVIAFLLIVFAEISPKVIGATYPEKISLPASVVLRPMMWVGRPFIWFVNLFVNLVLRLLRIDTAVGAEAHRLSPEELRSIIVEGNSFMPQKHSSILLNLFDLERISVNDIMTPRAQIEAINLDAPVEDILHQLATCYHNKLPVYEGEINRIVGILHVRKAISLLAQNDALEVEHFRRMLSAPYFIPEETDVLKQLQYFQENREKLGMIVDEYGEVQGLVTLEDIIEELVGEFTTSTPGGDGLQWDARQQCLVEGSVTLRELNRRLGLELPLDGPKTLNGLLLEQLQEIPDASVSLKFKGCVIEIVQVQHQSIKMVRLKRL